MNKTCALSRDTVLAALAAEFSLPECALAAAVARPLSPSLLLLPSLSGGNSREGGRWVLRKVPSAAEALLGDAPPSPVPAPFCVLAMATLPCLQ